MARLDLEASGKTQKTSKLDKLVFSENVYGPEPPGDSHVVNRPGVGYAAPSRNSVPNPDSFGVEFVDVDTSVPDDGLQDLLADISTDADENVETDSTAENDEIRQTKAKALSIMVVDLMDTYMPMLLGSAAKASPDFFKMKKEEKNMVRDSMGKVILHYKLEGIGDTNPIIGLAFVLLLVYGFKLMEVRRARSDAKKETK